MTRLFNKMYDTLVDFANSILIIHAMPHFQIFIEPPVAKRFIRSEIDKRAYLSVEFDSLILVDLV